jgi:tripartite-type tricarboxylate transporter receptor subunit TctC
MHRFSSRARALGALLALSAPLAQTQEYPAKPVTMVVPFAPGGTADIVARALVGRLGERLGQQVVVDNRGGAGGTIGSDIVAKSRPDGYTLMLHTSTHVISPALYGNLRYDPVRDFEAVAMLADAPFVVGVNPQLPVKTLQDYIARAKAKPGQTTYGSSGNGTILHLAGEIFRQQAGVDMVHVPYKGSGPATIDLIAGNIDSQFDSIVSLKTHIDAGKVRAIAVTGKNRSPMLPGVPTAAESGMPAYQVTSWYGVLGPAGMPRAVVQKLNTEIGRAAMEPAVKDRLQALGADVVLMSPEQFGGVLKVDAERWSKIVRSSGAKAD